MQDCPNYPSVLKIKRALLTLSERVPCSSINVKSLLEYAKVGRTTFYKYFPDIRFVWHTVSHDLLAAMGQRLDSLALTPNCMPARCSHDHLKHLADLSPVPFASYFSDFLFQYRGLIRNLYSKHGDPMFQVKWQELMDRIFIKYFDGNGCPATLGHRYALPLSYAYVSGCMEGIQRAEKSLIFDRILAVREMMDQICSYQTKGKWSPE